ncbi:magnesium transporter CorA family protein [Frankia sp. Cr1]|uniref:magnesium transporter CorA family protein n=1 Tax=Frankia sp. Cr1 TaxID=3073931 RepID=UPI002AD4390D|nr:magnesium transporter CorA family protein [Frankia sp. Cr1]
MVNEQEAVFGDVADWGDGADGCVVDVREHPDSAIGSSPPHTRAYRAGVLEASGFPVSAVGDYLERPGTVVWLDLCAPDHAGLQTIARLLKLDPLALEDAVSPGERPKVDRYRTHLFLNAYSVGLDLGTGALTAHEISAFVTPWVLVTVRGDEGFDIDAVVRHWDVNADLAVHGVGFLLHGLIDYLVDGYFDTVQELDAEIDKLEDLLFADTPDDILVQRRSFEIRKSLVLLRRDVLPMREVVNTLMRRDFRIIDEAMLPYLQDVYDHVLRATEWTESLRDLVTTILETNLTIQSNRLNVIMKKLTGWAAVIAVPTAVTGFYGQNVPYPGFGSEWGFLVSLVILLGCASGLYLAFRRRGWL